MSDSSRTESTFNSLTIHDTYEHVQAGELESLIHILQHKIDTRDPQIKSIKDTKLLMSSLHELNSLVGMDRLKDSIALQVMRLVDGANNGEKSSKMLNTILYGPPGVGKTKVGIILAKIWCSLGYLKKPILSGGNGGGGGTTSNNFVNSYQPQQSQTINPLILAVLLVLFYCFTYIVSGISYVYNKAGFMWLMYIFIATILIVGLLYWNTTTYNYITNIVKEPEQDNLNLSTTLSGNTKSSKTDNIITVVSRQDFVAEYVGQTATKTKALLYANMGKVIFIDEAYSLLNGDRDPFGMEALTTLNLFMSEHPNSIAVIFAGYKDLMKHGIFKAQPGLPRRCMWHFECTGYDGNQLSDIFLRQVYSAGWAIRKSDYNNIHRLICENESTFKSYGGDTERLVFFSQLEASRNNMMSSCTEKFTMSMDKSFSRYLSSNIDGTGTRSGGSCSTRSGNSFVNTDTGSGSGSGSGYTDTGSGGSRSGNRYTGSSGSSRSKSGNFGGHRGKIITYEDVQHGLRRLCENDIQTS